MLVDLSDPTLLTKTEALLMLLSAESFIENDEVSPVIAIGAALLDVYAALYELRKESIGEKVGRIP